MSQPIRIDRIRAAENRRESRHLLERSSLGTPHARAMIESTYGEAAKLLTGMAEEQADWEEDL